MYANNVGTVLASTILYYLGSIYIYILSNSLNVFYFISQIFAANNLPEIKIKKTTSSSMWNVSVAVWHVVSIAKISLKL